MTRYNDDATDARRLPADIDDELARLGRVRATAVAEIAGLAAEQAMLGCHPNHIGYLYGGTYASRGMGLAHILPLAGIYRLPAGDALDRLTSAAESDVSNGDLLRAVRLVCESESRLETAGFDWFASQGLTNVGAIDRRWIKKPKLGLGQPARLHGLTREQHPGHRGLYALAPADVRDRFADVEDGKPERTYGDLMQRVIDAGGPALVALGAAAIHSDAKERYDEDGRRFAAHQHATGRRDWRGKPALRAQGFLAMRTATAHDIATPSERNRGGAADWLDKNGANVRFRED